MYPLLSSFSLPVVCLFHYFSSLSLYLHVYLTTNIPSSASLPLSLLTTIPSKISNIDISSDRTSQFERYIFGNLLSQNVDITSGCVSTYPSFAAGKYRSISIKLVLSGWNPIPQVVHVPPVHRHAWLFRPIPYTIFCAVVLSGIPSSSTYAHSLEGLTVS